MPGFFEALSNRQEPLKKIYTVTVEGKTLEVSHTKKLEVLKIGEENYSRIMVPPGIWFGFMGINLKDSLVLNIASCLHDPEEVQRLDIKKISYNWVK